MGLKNLFLKKDGLTIATYYMVYSFCLGYRTFEIINGIMIHPLEVFIYGSLIRIILTKPKKYNDIPFAITTISILFVAYFSVDVLTRFNIYIINEFKNVIIIYLIFYLFQYIDVSNEYLKNIFRKYIFSASIIALLGIFENYFPIIIAGIFGHGVNPMNTSGDILFQRLMFLFWGSPLGANLIPPVFPMLLFLRMKDDQNFKGFFLITSLVLINLTAIYLSGNRISWLNLTLMVIIMLFQFRSNLFPNIKIYMLSILLGFILYIYSQPVEGRYLSMFKVMTGQIDNKYDSSSMNRLQKAQTAIASIKANPMGTGWSSQGWIHNDLLQIASTTGLPNAIIFFLSLFYLLWRLIKKIRLKNASDYTFYFVGLNIILYIVISFFLNGNLLLVQTGVPLIMLWSIIISHMDHIEKNKIKSLTI